MEPSRGESRLEQWGTLAGSLAHEIKNPLSTMNISLQLLKEDLAARSAIPSSQILPKVDLLIEEVKNLQKILNDFLRLARVPELSLKERDPNQLLAELLQFMAPELQRHAVVTVSHFDRSRPTIHADPDLLRQAFMNLFRNALDAMPGGGTLTVQTVNEEANFRIDVIDTGVGIPDEIHRRVFDGFFSTKPGGNGIGLAVTRQIIERHGGRITLQSAVGHGSKFSIFLPACQPGPGTTS